MFSYHADNSSILDTIKFSSRLLLPRPRPAFDKFEEPTNAQLSCIMYALAWNLLCVYIRTLSLPDFINSYNSVGTGLHLVFGLWPLRRWLLGGAECVPFRWFE